MHDGAGGETGRVGCERNDAMGEKHGGAADADSGRAAGRPRADG